MVLGSQGFAALSALGSEYRVQVPVATSDRDSRRRDATVISLAAAMARDFAREKFGERLALMLADDGLDEAMAALRALALVDRETILDERDASIAADAIRLHRLVREVAAVRCEGESGTNRGARSFRHC
jgi:hypothetical protein